MAVGRGARENNNRALRFHYTTTLPQPSIRAAGFAVAGPAGLLEAQRYHRLKIALSKVERDRRTEISVGCRCVWNLMLIL